MRVNSSTRFAAMAALVGALACAGNSARDTDEAAAARDTTTSDTLGQNQPGYRGMERDTTIAPPDSQPSDTFLQNQGTGQAQDTAGYSGMERVDTAGQKGQADTTGAWSADTSAANQSSNQTGRDSTGQSPTGDTTGYGNTQNQADTTTSR